jgi:hypothetical protein
MRIEGYPPFAPAVPPANRAGGASFAAQAAAQNASAPAENMTAQEKLARLLDEKHWMTESAFNGDPSGELGKHIDLRV